MKFWLYYFIRSFMELPFRTYFRNKSITGLKNIPKNKPILICANHAGSFLDGVVIEYTFREKVFTLVRGDAFNKPVFNKVLRSMLLLPIYRARDAEAEKARVGNAGTFDECYELFQKDKKILIFSEGIAYPEKAMRPVKKGSAGLAADMIKRSGGEMDLHIVPCGINYSKFGSRDVNLQVSFGQAIPMKQYYAEMIEDDRKFARDFTPILEEKITELVVEVKGENEEEKELIHEMLINEYQDFSTYRSYDSDSVAIAERLHKVNEANLQAARSYKDLLEKYGLSDRSLSKLGVNFAAIMLALCTLAMSLPVAILLTLIWKIAKKYTNKLVKNVVLFDSVHFGLGLIGSLFLLIFLIVFTYAIAPDQWTLVWKTIALVFAVIGAPAWFIAFRELKYFKQALNFLGLDKQVKEELKDLRNKVLNQD
ncbi:MAG: 1-acyl-sn-glycerol-3-phosphate acyltransferase [Bacteroidia bacterium]